MALGQPSVRTRVALLVLVPLAFLIALFGYTVGTSVSSALALRRSEVMMDRLSAPTASLQRALAAERAEVVTYYAGPTAGRLASLRESQAKSTRAEAVFRAAAQSIQQSASAGGRKALARLGAGLSQLAALRAGIPGRTASGRALFAAYGGALAASYQVLEQAILQEGNSSQVLPGIAVIELAISDEYLQQESALLNGDFAAHAFPTGDRRTFASLVGAHRLLYAQSLAYLTQADRATLQSDVSPQLAGRLTALENTVAADHSPAGPPPVPATAWNATVGTFNTQIQQAVGQAESRLAAGARAQADAKIRTLAATGAVGLAGVLVSLALSLWLAAGLTRRLRRLRDSALELANVQLPGVLQRLRSGQDVDVAAEVPPLAAEADEIGQVNAAFNAARRTAIEAAVDEAKLRRGISQVFRNLARRNQSLLHRQMALLDALEKRESDPGSLESLYRIDHLTTRMRRHAESLVVLAGDVPKRGWRNPVPFVDVLRAAAAEVEDYTRIKVLTSTHVSLAGPAVADVIHLIAELAENATVYSPRANQVRILGELVANGFAIEIEDRGLGLNDEELAALNHRLEDPPPFDLSDSDQLGIFVAAQLAKRHGIQASLTRSPFGGVSAVVLIPMELVVTTGEPGGEPGQEEVRPLRPGRHGGLTALDGAGNGSNGRGRPDRRDHRPALVPGSLETFQPGSPAAPLPGSIEPLPPDGTGPLTAASTDPRGPASAFFTPASAEGFPPAGPFTPADPFPPASTSPFPAAGADPFPPAGADPFPAAGADPFPPAGADPFPPASRFPSASADPPAPATPPWQAAETAGPPPLGPPAPGPGGDRTENGLPVRVPRASLAPQLQQAPAARATGGGSHALRDPETARTVMSAFRRGWKDGLADPRVAPDAATNVAQEGQQQ